MPDSCPEIIATGHGDVVKYRGRFLYSSSDPVKQAENRADAFQLTEKTLILLPSPLLFYGVRNLLSRLPRGSHILCVETDQALMALSIEHFPPALRNNGNITFIRTDNPSHIAEIVRELGTWKFRRALLIPITGGFSINRKKYEELYQAAESVIRSYWQDRMTTIHMAELWFKNIFLNSWTQINSPFFPAETSGGHLLDKPVCVTGAGESLESSIPLLNALRSRMFILTVDTALPALQKFGITPDAVCVMEAQHANLYDFHGFGNADSIILFSDITAYPAGFRFFSGPSYLFLSGFTRCSLFDRMKHYGLLPHVIPGMGSIGVTAAYIAFSITSGPVFFTGLDFSYTQGKSHARGTPAHDRMLRSANRFIPPNMFAQTFSRPRVKTEGKQGKQVESDLVLLSYVESFRMLLRLHPRTYDLGTSGVKTSARMVTDPEQVSEIIRQAQEVPGAAASDEKKLFLKRNIEKEDIERFLRGELELVEETIEKGRNYITACQSESAGAALESVLRKTDYVYLHFPDDPPLPKIEPGFIKRAVISAQRYRMIIRNALNTARGI